MLCDNFSYTEFEDTNNNNCVPISINVDLMPRQTTRLQDASQSRTVQLSQLLRQIRRPAGLGISPIQDVLGLVQASDKLCSEIYVEHMYSMGLGYPCFKPFRAPAQIGDVGFVDADGFKAIFNIYEPPEDFFRQCGAPEPSDIDLQEEIFREGDTLSTNAHQATIDYSADYQSILRFRFPCVGPAAAVLAFTSSADLEIQKDSVALCDFLCRHAVDIYRFSRGKQCLAPEEPLYVVTGCVRTDSWALAAHTQWTWGVFDNNMVLENQDKPDRSGSLDDGSVPTYSWVKTGGAEARDGQSSSFDQTLFLRGFLLTPSPLFLSKTMHPWGTGPDYSEDCPTSKSKTTNPLNCINEAVLAGTSADFAITHDDYWAKLVKDRNIVSPLRSGSHAPSLSLKINSSDSDPKGPIRPRLIFSTPVHCSQFRSTFQPPGFAKLQQLTPAEAEVDDDGDDMDLRTPRQLVRSLEDSDSSIMVDSEYAGIGESDSWRPQTPTPATTRKRSESDESGVSADGRAAIEASIRKRTKIPPFVPISMWALRDPTVEMDDVTVRPPHSYNEMIQVAIWSSPQQRLTFQGIVRAIEERYAFYAGQRVDSVWKDAVYHILVYDPHRLYWNYREKRVEYWALNPIGFMERNIEGSQ